MARIPYPDSANLDSKAAELMEKLPNINIFRMLSHSGGLLGPFTRLGNAFLYKGTLDPVLREIAILRVGHQSAASYEVYQHERIGREIGMSEELLSAIKTEPGNAVFTPLESLIMQYTDELVHNVKAGDEVFEALSDQFTVTQMQELTLVVGYYMMVCRFLETFEIDIEDGGAN